MTHRVHPYIFRIGQVTTWKSRWFNLKKTKDYLHEDVLLREWLGKKLRQAHVETVEIERSPGIIHIIIKTSRPGILIGRGGEGSEKLKNEIKKNVFKIRKRFKQAQEKVEIRLTVEEVRVPEMSAAIVAQSIVDEIEKRTPFRRSMKQALEKVAAIKEVKGVKIAVKGRLDGAEMARYEWLKKGRVPLQTIRSNVDYAEKTAFTTYGTIGVKVWIYKGDIFDNSKIKNQISK